MDRRLNDIALNHGLDEQLEQIVEECGELIVAIKKYKRYGKRNDGFETYYLAHVGEEIVDVEIMVDQLKMLIEGFDFERFREHQIERELARIKEAQNDTK